MEATRNKARRAKYGPQKWRRWVALEMVPRNWKFHSEGAGFGAVFRTQKLGR